jgi:hypothetical protein
MPRLLLALALLAPAAYAHEDSWVLVGGRDNVSMHGDFHDVTIAQRHLRELGAGYIWFRHDGKAYVIKDGKIVAEVEAAMKPQEELGEEQGRLGQRQSELGAQQARLGKKQAALGQKQADLAMHRASRDMNGEHATADDREAERELSETQRELSRAQQTLGREQAKMGREQQKMGEQQRQLSKEFERKMEKLIATSLRDGTATPVND